MTAAADSQVAFRDVPATVVIYLLFSIGSTFVMSDTTKGAELGAHTSRIL